jgi:hypothetical protein
MDALRAFGAYALGAVAFVGWPLFLFLIFHWRRYGAAIVLALSILTFLIGSIIATLGSTPSIRSPLPFYGWLALPYLFIALRFFRRRHACNYSASATSPNERNA